jgi:hypothetical protein
MRGYYLLEGFNAFGTNVFFLGVFFHARANHGFSDSANLMLAAAQGAAYVATTRAGGRLADRIGADRSIALGLSLMCLALTAGWRLPSNSWLFATVALYSASTALTWPALEAAIARAPGQLALARRAGLYNVIWSFIGAAGFFISGPLFARDPETVFWLPLAAHLIQLAGLAAAGLGLFGFSVSPAIHQAKGWREEKARRPAIRSRDERVQRPTNPETSIDEETTGLVRGDPQRPDPGAITQTATPASVRISPEARAGYLSAARIANGLGYFLFGGFSALAPTIGERLGLGARLAIWLVSAYLFARSAAFLLFWRWGGWEYRRGWLAAALLLPPAALAVAFYATSPAAVVGGLAVLGVLSGVAYSASLYASLDREGGEGEGGGLHEWVIGLGVLLGPLAGAAGIRLIDGATGAGGFVAALGSAAALAGLAPLLRKQTKA